MILSILLLIGFLFLPYFFSTNDQCTKCNDAKRELNLINEKFEKRFLNNAVFPSTLPNFFWETNDELNKFDPWGNAYHFSIFSDKGLKCYIFWTFGSDSLPGGRKEHELDLFSENCKIVEREYKDRTPTS